MLVFTSSSEADFSKVKRWVAGPYEHVFLYLGAIDFAPLDKPPLRVPMLFESYGRGVCFRSLSERYGQEIVVMRLKSESDRERIPRVLEEAIKLASDSQSYYDYLCIVRFAIPRLICEKLGLPMPLKYHRDPWHICSEAVNEVFIQGGLELLYLEDVPLPGDFVTDSLLLEKVWTGILSEEVV
ncbi:hypothetical protein ES705_44241 [subsurface metagenome]